MLNYCRSSGSNKHAELLIQLLEKATADGFKSDGNIMRATNPLMLFVLTTDIMLKLKERFRSLAFRIDFIYSKFEEKFVVIYE